jgi:hypothetical protein
MVTEELVAADKVALILSNRTYHPQMTNLITPHCDAETLASQWHSLLPFQLCSSVLGWGPSAAEIQDGHIGGFESCRNEGNCQGIQAIAGRRSLWFFKYFLWHCKICFSHQQFSTLLAMDLRQMANAICFQLGHRERIMGRRTA